MSRVTLVTEIPAPYRTPLFNALAERVDLHVVFLRRTNPKRPYAFEPEQYRFEWEILRGTHVARGNHWLIFNVGVRRALRRSRPDVVVVGGWVQPAFWQARLPRVPALAWVESTSRDERGGNPVIELLKRRFLDRCAGFLVPGRASARYLEELGVDPERIVVAPNAADPLLASPRRELRLTAPTALVVGRLDPEKAVEVAIRAVADLPDVQLAIAGTGVEEAALRALADEVAPDRVRFLGFVSPADLADWYAAADVFVLPSRSEQWSIPLNEAASAGLPLVASDAAGAAHDLVDDGVNGFRVPAGEVERFAAAIRAALEPGFAAQARIRSLELASGHTPAVWADAVAALVTATLG